MNPQTLIIAPPASGKSGVDTLNKQVMSVLRAQDQISRNALKEYKRKRKERTTSSKEQKQAALVEPQGMWLVGLYLSSMFSGNSKSGIQWLYCSI